MKEQASQFIEEDMKSLTGLITIRGLRQNLKAKKGINLSYKKVR
jgi:hypothetical protein